MLVPTTDTVRYGYLMEKLLAVRRSVLFTGGTGVGKVKVFFFFGLFLLCPHIKFFQLGNSRKALSCYSASQKAAVERWLAVNVNAY